MRIEWYRLDIF